jgi:L-lactate dehydrogenase complex protein LldG
MARGGVAETGSLILDARDGRRTQLLAPTHVVLVRASDIHETLSDALASLRTDLPSAIGFHSGPSKSADIGQIMVKGVHGPGRVVALVEFADARAAPQGTHATGDT